MSKRLIVSIVAVAFCCAAIVATSATAAGKGRPELATGPASGWVPANAHAARPGGGGHVSNLIWGGGPVMHSTTVVPVFWGSKWANATFVGDKITGLDYLYSHMGGSAYLHTNFEYTDSTGHVNTTSVSISADLMDAS